MPAILPACASAPARAADPWFPQSSNYNERMPLLRYVALAALVVWLGDALQAVPGGWLRPLERVAYACGALMIVSLFVMKFVGPPPADFAIRVALVALMLGITTVAVFWGRSTLTNAATLALGCVLLSWYARE